MTLVPYIARRRRAEDQADAALGEEAARDRHPARHPALPLRSAARARALKKKIALFSNVAADAVFTAAGRRRRIYEVPLTLPRRGARRQDRRAAQHLVARARARRRGSASSQRSRSPQREVTIGIVGKYVDLVESYKIAQRGAGPRRHRQRLPRGPRATSTPRRSSSAGAEALLRRRRRHPGARPASALAAPRARSRRSATRARSSVPFFGICFGMQLAVVEFARNVCRPGGRELDRVRSADAATRSSTSCPSSATSSTKGGDHAPRRVSRACCSPGTRARRGLRHRRDQRAPPPPLRGQQRLPRARSTSQGLVLSGLSPDKRLVEMIELPRPPVLRRLPVPPRVQDPAA